MEKFKKLPIGVENFIKIREDNFYYVDKTRLIEKLLENWGEATLFTRPRRFGKSLNMSMLKSFFEIGCDKSLFDGLYIASRQELCDRYMGQFPVIFISLKDIDARDFETARGMTIKIINREARRLQYLAESGKLTAIDKELFFQLLKRDMDDETLAYSLRELTELLHKHHGKKAIVLIDEYDVPLSKASEGGYYDKMAALIRSLFGAVLKSNEDLYFGILTGCLRVGKESIFTGLNNFKVYSVTNAAFDEYFGFTDTEVRELLSYYDLSDKYTAVKEWYDGYRFGNEDIFCPWDVICYCQDQKENENFSPQNYWMNTSGNDILKRFIDGMDEQRKLTKTELEQLINGEAVQKEVEQELTYKELYASADHIWSILFMTGYLTRKGLPEGKRYKLAIPNREIRDIMAGHVLSLFKEEIAQDGVMLNSFCQALENGDAGAVEQILSAYLKKTISIRDTFVRKSFKENFYHGILLGILGFKESWTVLSNKEAGEGFSDIFVRTDRDDVGIVIEVKYAEDEAAAVRESRKAVEQIDHKRYADAFEGRNVSMILKYGIACFKKNCRVYAEKQQREKEERGHSGWEDL